MAVVYAAHAAENDASKEPNGAAASVQSAAPWVRVPKVNGRLTARDIGLVINTADPYSVEVGAYYARQRHLSPEQILKVEMPTRTVLKREEFDALDEAVRRHFGPQTQALALAWNQPYAVDCNSITSALALGIDESVCQQTCAKAAKPSPYFDSASIRPFTDHRMRLAMLLAARNVESAQRMIDRGVHADGTLGLRGAPPVSVHFVVTADSARNVRSLLYPAPQLARKSGVDVRIDKDGPPEHAQRVLLYEVGLTSVARLDSIQWVDGALADHLTSFGGKLERTEGSGQMSAIEWLESGATASYGTVSEPCNHLQKFPHPQLLLLNYMQGSTAIEAYWKSVAWPQQGVFIGEPLAAPFSRLR